jgi:hypothetical protein
MSDPVMVHKITLPTGKVVLLKDIEMRDEEFAARAAAKKSGDSAMGMGYAMHNELLKVLIVEVDGKKLSASDKEQLGKFLSYKEFVMVRKVLEKLMGETEAEPTVEFVTGGQQSPG